MSHKYNVRNKAIRHFKDQKKQGVKYFTIDDKKYHYVKVRGAWKKKEFEG